MLSTKKKNSSIKEPRPKKRLQKIQVVKFVGYRLKPKDKKVDEKILVLTKKIRSITKVSSKIYELKTYKKIMSDLLYLHQWKKVIKEEIQKLENHNI